MAYGKGNFTLPLQIGRHESVSVIGFIKVGRGTFHNSRPRNVIVSAVWEVTAMPKCRRNSLPRLSWYKLQSGRWPGGGFPYECNFMSRTALHYVSDGSRVCTRVWPEDVRDEEKTVRGRNSTQED